MKKYKENDLVFVKRDGVRYVGRMVMCDNFLQVADVVTGKMYTLEEFESSSRDKVEGSHDLQ